MTMKQIAWGDEYGLLDLPAESRQQVRDLVRRKASEAGKTICLTGTSVMGYPSEWVSESDPGEVLWGYVQDAINELQLNDEEGCNCD